MPAGIHRNIVWSYINWGVTFVAPLVMVPIYVRFLGTKAYGDWIVIVSITSYLGLANLGLGQTLSNRIAEAVAAAPEAELGKLISTAFFVYAALAMMIGTVIFFAGPQIAAKFRLHAGAELAAAMVYIVMNLASFPLRVNSMVLRGFERVDQYQAIDTAVAIARICLLALALAIGFRLIGVAVINGAAIVAASGAAYFWARRLTAELRPRLSRFSSMLLREMVAPSVAFLGVQAGGSLIFGTDNLVIGYAIGSAAVAGYAISFRLIMMARSLFGVAIGALVPTITASYARRELAQLGRGFSFATRLGLLYGTAATGGLWIAGPSFIRLWAGPGIFPGRFTFALQLFLLIASGWVSSAAVFLSATTQHYAWSALTVFEGILNLVLSLWWVRIWGLPGVIGATVAASVVTNCWYLPYKAVRTLQIPLSTAMREFVPALALSALALGAVLFIWEPGAPSWSEVFCAEAMAEAAIFVAFAFIAFSRDERAIALDWAVRRIRLKRAA
jgi:O-antigen/teichoic acid export membrane protein